MKYKVEFERTALKSLSKLDKYTLRMILNYISARLDGCENPREFGNPLSSNLAGLWRYRIGDYRIIVKIEDNKLIILVLTIGHRKETYNN